VVEAEVALAAEHVVEGVLDARDHARAAHLLGLRARVRVDPNPNPNPITL